MRVCICVRGRVYVLVNHPKAVAATTALFTTAMREKDWDKKRISAPPYLCFYSLGMRGGSSLTSIWLLPRRVGSATYALFFQLFGERESACVRGAAGGRWWW
jgi:hypothetical protein